MNQRLRMGDCEHLQSAMDRHETLGGGIIRCYTWKSAQDKIRAVLNKCDTVLYIPMSGQTNKLGQLTARYCYPSERAMICSSKNMKVGCIQKHVALGSNTGGDGETLQLLEATFERCKQMKWKSEVQSDILTPVGD